MSVPAAAQPLLRFLMIAASGFRHSRRVNKIRTAIEALRGQRIRQGDVIPALDCLIAQAFELGAEDEIPPVREAAAYMRERAFELRRMANSLPKFAVEDLIDEAIARLEAAAKGAAPSR